MNHLIKTFLLWIVFTFSIYAQSDTLLVYLYDIDSTIATDVRYATENNFMREILYPSSKVFLRKIVAERLKEINTYLKKNHNLRLKIYDGYRPLSVQKKMWKRLPDDRYVANPSKGSRHNRGAAVDLTLIDENGNELDMGTGYDDFSNKAHWSYKKFPPEVLKNRNLLKEVMTKFGFETITSEWWHYDFKGWSKFSILDQEIK